MVNGFYKSNNVSLNRLTVGIITFGIILILNFLFQRYEAFYDIFYLKGLFQLVRISHDYTIGLLPVPSIYLTVPVILLYFFYRKVHSLKSLLIAFSAFVIWVINLFYLLWGFNYTQPSIYDALNITPIEIDSSYLAQAFMDQTKVVEALAQQKHDSIRLTELENHLRELQEEILEDFGIPTIGRVRIRKLPAGLLLSIRTSGIYIPHAVEGHIDGGSYHKQHPFTLAHEMAHGYSYADESVCNFIAYLTCRKSELAIVRYSAELAYWRYLARAYRQYHPDEWTEIYGSLDSALLADLQQIRDHITRYPDLMPIMKDIIYDNYLKSHGVSAGIKSYDMMIDLIAAYQDSTE